MKVSRAMPDKIVKGRDTHSQWSYGNISFDKVEQTKTKFSLRGEMLAHET